VKPPYVLLRLSLALAALLALAPGARA